MTVMGHPVANTKHLVRRDGIPGGIEGTGRKAASLHWRGHASIILLPRTFR
jgi:hypothetical protein